MGLRGLRHCREVSFNRTVYSPREKENYEGPSCASFLSPYGRQVSDPGHTCDDNGIRERQLHVASPSIPRARVVKRPVDANSVYTKLPVAGRR